MLTRSLDQRSRGSEQAEFSEPRNGFRVDLRIASHAHFDHQHDQPMPLHSVHDPVGIHSEPPVPLQETAEWLAKFSGIRREFLADCLCDANAGLGIESNEILFPDKRMNFDLPHALSTSQADPSFEFF